MSKADSNFRKKAFKYGVYFSIILVMFYYAYTKLKIPIFEVFEQKTLDLRYKIRGEIKKDFDVVIVGIDEKSLVELGKWPWKRDIHGRLVTELSKLEVKSIGFDVSFNEPASPTYLTEYKNGLKEILLKNYNDNKIEKDAAMELGKQINSLNLREDIDFAIALKGAKNVTIGTYNIAEEKEAKLTEEIINNKSYINSAYNNIEGIVDEIKEVDRTGTARFIPKLQPYKILPPIEILAQQCYGVATYEIDTPDTDGVFRSIPLVVKELYSNMYFPPLYFLVYLNAFNLTMKDNVLLDLSKTKVEIYKNALKKEGLLKTVNIDIKGLQNINYYGKEGTFTYCSYVDVLNEEVPKEKLKGKIVLVGYTDTAKGLYDLRVTPFSPNYPGVEVHATAIQNLIENKFMTRLNAFGIMGMLLQIFLIFLFAIIITLGFAYSKFSFRKGNFITILSIVTYIIVAQVLFNIGIWVELFYPIIVFVFLYMLLMATNYFDEELEKKKIKHAFQHYMSPSLMEEVLKHPEKLKLGGERKNLTAFFSDIEGFTTISEGLEPEQLVEFLNEYLSEMTDIIFKHEGMVDKFEGDAIMAVFGSPIYMEDHPLKSCMAALEYQERLAQLREKWAGNGRPPIYARIGINTGEMVSGNMGSSQRFEYTVIGDEVNLASRLEGANKEYNTYTMISYETYRHVMDFVEVRELDIIRVKGKKKPVDVFELLCKKGELKEEKTKMLEMYSQGLILYRMKEWNRAIEFFNKALEIDSADGPSKLYIKRCQYFIQNPPEEDWDGVYTMKSK